MENRIRILRKERGLTQEEVAELVGTSFGTVSKLETGRRRLTSDWIARFAKAFDVPPTDIITEPLPVRRVPVTIVLQWGHWARDMQVPGFKPYDVAAEDLPEYRDVSLYGCELGDGHANLRYPETTVIVMAPFDELDEELIVGKRYHVRRTRADGACQNTVMRLVQSEEGELWFTTESDHPAYQASMPLHGFDGERLEVCGRAIGSWIRE